MNFYSLNTAVFLSYVMMLLVVITITIKLYRFSLISYIQFQSIFKLTVVTDIFYLLIGISPLAWIYIVTTKTPLLVVFCLLASSYILYSIVVHTNKPRLN